MEQCTTVEFVKAVQPFNIGERAGLHPDTAALYASAGIVRVIHAGVPRVDPKTIEERKHALAAERAQGIEAMLAEALAGRGPSARNRAA